MPTPVGHALGAIAAGTVARGRDPIARPWVAAAILAAIGIAPDLDLLWNRHSRETHSVGAALIIAGVAAWRRWPIAATRGRMFTAALLASLTHPLLDALGSDSAPPIGVMMFWPFSTTHIYFGAELFPGVTRAWWRPEFVGQIANAIGVEVLVLLPVFLFSTWRQWRK